MGVKRFFQVNKAQEMANRGQHGLANVVSWKVISFQKHDVDAFTCKRRRCVRPGGTTAYDKHGARLGNRHGKSREGKQFGLRSNQEALGEYQTVM
jgi:hypothetical protein